MYLSKSSNTNTHTHTHTHTHIAAAMAAFMSEHRKTTHRCKVSGGEVVGLVLEIERVEPLKERVVESKLQLGVVLDCICQLTCK